jgi:hypothetical protein
MSPEVSLGVNPEVSLGVQPPREKPAGALAEKLALKLALKLAKELINTIPTCQWPLSTVIPRLVTPSHTYSIRLLQPSCSQRAS